MENSFLEGVATEDALKVKLESVLEKDFYLHSEVSGINGEYGKQGIIDYMCYPKQETINIGFPSWWFGIEVKYFSDTSGIEQKYDHLLQQAEFYCDSAFTKKPTLNCCRPTFVLVYDNLSLCDNTSGNKYMTNPEMAGFFRGMLYHARSKKVGSLQISKTRIGLRYLMRLYSTIFSVYRLHDGGVYITKPNQNIKNEVLHVTLGSQSKQVPRNTFVRNIVPSSPESETLLYYPD